MDVGLPSSFYARRELLSMQLAACVVIAPERCPTREQLPRDVITDDALRRVLALSAVSLGDATRLGVAVYREFGASYFCRLIELCHPKATGPLALVSRVDWYAHQLRRCEDIAASMDKHMRGIAAVRAAADNLPD